MNEWEWMMIWGFVGSISFMMRVKHSNEATIRLV